MPRVASKVETTVTRRRCAREAGELAQDRPRLRETTGLQDDPPQRAAGARPLDGEQRVDGVGKVAARLATDAAVRQHGDGRARAAFAQDRAVEADLARLVHDHGGVGALGKAGEVAQQGGFARSEEPRQDDEIRPRSPFTARCLLPSCALYLAGTSSAQLALTRSRTSLSSSPTSKITPSLIVYLRPRCHSTRLVASSRRIAPVP